MKRRTLLGWLLVVPIASVPLLRWAFTRTADTWDRDVKLLRSRYADDLNAVTHALLPSTLDREQANAVASGFLGWLEGQRPDAELNHLGFKLQPGVSSAPRPGARRALIVGSNYVRQLDQLRAQARPRPLANLSRVELSMLLMSALQVSGARDIPPGPGGANILLDVLSFFYRSADATDLFHGRSIGALSCRGLEGVDRPPLPLTKRSQG